MIDVSNHNPIAIWPNSKEYEQHKLELEDSSVTSSWVEMDLHYGTHIDSPLHHIKNGDMVDKFPEYLMENICQVIEVDSDVSEFDVECDVVFLKFKNHDLNKPFNPRFNGLTLKGANYLKGKIKMIGTNYLSIEKFDSDGSVHKTLLNNNIWILESLNLEMVNNGIYKYYCFPLKIKAEASPVRIMMKK
jgi:arylformamidase